MDKKVEVYNFWWQVWEALDEESKEACRKELKEDYENALESVKEDSRHYDGPDTSSLEEYIIGTVTHYIDELCGPQEENGKMICTGPCADELPDYDEDGEAPCTKANFLWVLDID